jgi:DTW domain-containing protein YfiP
MRCVRCLLRDELCLCAEIPRIETHTRVVIVRHIAERWRSSNSGRLAALALPNAEIVEHGGDDAVPDSVLAQPGTWLVYPEGPPRREPPSPPPSRLLFLDATWHQARRMRQRLPGLRGMPILALAVDEVPPDRLRESPGGGRVSTIEAIARALRLLEGDAPADALERLFAVHVARARASGRR